MLSEMPHEQTFVNSLTQTIDDYLADCRGRGLSLKTVNDNYGYALKQVLLPWCEAAGIKSVQQIESKVLTRWQGDLLSKPGRRGKLISRFSIEGWVDAVNRFMRWARAEGELAHEARVKPAKPPRVVLLELSREEIALLERTAQTERDKLIVRILGDTGIRASELLGLRTSDLVQREREWFLRVRGKGARERLVPVPRLGQRIQRYARGIDEGGRLFLTLRRQPRTGEREPLTLSGLQKAVRALGREAGIKRPVYPHLFRHSLITHALRSGAGPLQVARVVGHESLRMIERNYSHLTDRDAYEAMRKLFMDD